VQTIYIFNTLITKFPVQVGESMNKITTLALVFTCLVMVGCASNPQKSVALSQDFYSSGDKTVGVYVDELPAADTHFFGAGCLLCYGAAAIANSSLTSHIQALSTDDLIGVDESIAKLVTKKGIAANIINAPVDFEGLKKFTTQEEDFAKQDYRPLRESLGVDKLVVIDFNIVGAHRSYSGYIPTSDPVGAVIGKAYTVDLATNKYILYEEIDVKVSTSGEWDEPPSFPGITNAYYQAIEIAKEKVADLFK